MFVPNFTAASIGTNDDGERALFVAGASNPNGVRRIYVVVVRDDGQVIGGEVRRPHQSDWTAELVDDKLPKENESVFAVGTASLTPSNLKDNPTPVMWQERLRVEIEQK